MKITEAIEIIRFNTSTINDLSNKSINDLFTDKNIVQQFKYAINKYAKKTKAIEDIYSLSLPINTEWVATPPLALRSESYKMVYVWIGSVKYLLSDPNLLVQNTNISYQTINGIPKWFVPWKDRAYINPTANNIYNTTTLNGSISATDTTITLTDAAGFLQWNGKITIGTEKINYKYRTNNVLYECIRGDELTTAASHSNLDAVSENNLWLFYRRLHFDFSANDKKDWDRELELPEEHIEMVTDYTSYKLLSKVDTQRASVYKFNFDEWLTQAERDVMKGRTRIGRTGFIRNPYEWETINPNYLL